MHTIINFATTLFDLGNNSVEDVAFSIGNFQIRWYGILIFIGFIVAIVFASIKIKYWYKIPFEPFFYFIFIAIPVSVLGARIWSYVIGDAKMDWSGNVLYQFFQFNGMAIQGGVIFTTIAGLIFFPLILEKPKYQIRTNFNGKEYVKSVSTFLYADAIVPCILIGQIIGRWGNFINGEVYGALATPEQLHWLKVLMPAVYDGMWINVNGVPELHQPLFLYESFANFFLFIFLYVIMEFIKGHKVGDITSGYFIGYGIVRIIMEPLRENQFNFTMTYVTTGFMMAGGILFILYNHLYLCKHRNIKFIWMYYVKVTFIFKLIWSKLNKKYRNYMEKIDPKKENYLRRTKPEFYRDESQFLYYKGH